MWNESPELLNVSQFNPFSTGERRNKTMKRKMSLTLLALLFTAFVAAFPAKSLPADSMWITPSNLVFDTNVNPIGTKFNVTVWLNVTNTNSWQFYLVYNKAHLSALRGDYTGNFKSQWSSDLATDSVAFSIGDHNATHGYVLHGEVLKASRERTAAGSLTWIEFEIIQAPPTGGALSSELRLDVIGLFNSFAMDKDFNPITLTYGKATYTYSAPWTPPPAADLSVNPRSISNRSLTPSNNFQVSVNIEHATGVAFFNFKLNFNSSIIKAQQVIFGGFFPPPITPTIEVNNVTGYVRVSATLDPSAPSRNGSGTLATIEFHVEGNGSTTLSLTDVQIKDKQSRVLPVNVYDGFFTNTALLGDLNNDGKVDISDVAMASAAFGSFPGHPRWNPAADIDKDGFVNIFDIALVCQNFGRY